jgi:hypothetical protein
LLVQIQSLTSATNKVFCFPFAPTRTSWYRTLQLRQQFRSLFSKFQRDIGLRSKTNSHPVADELFFSNDHVLCACKRDLAMIAGPRLCVCACVCVEKEISYFRFSPDFVPKQGGLNVFFSIFVDDISFPGASKVSFTFGLPRAATLLDADIFSLRLKLTLWR